VSGFVLRRTPERALYLVEATALGLLFVGIHNAWDSAVWMATLQAREGAPGGPPGRKLSGPGM